MDLTIASTMNTHKFIKEVNGWHVDLPSELKKFGESDLVMTEGAEAILDLVARGKQTVTLTMDTEPFRKAAVLELIELCAAPHGGAYYKMCDYRGRLMKEEMWLCDMPLAIFGDMPERIYIKKIS